MNSEESGRLVQMEARMMTNLIDKQRHTRKKVRAGDQEVGDGGRHTPCFTRSAKLPSTEDAY